jgi:hypothetical protein
MSLIQLVLPIAAGLLLAVVLQALVSPRRVTDAKLEMLFPLSLGTIRSG